MLREFKMSYNQQQNALRAWNEISLARANPKDKIQ
jgi:hypothetical protein